MYFELNEGSNKQSALSLMSTLDIHCVNLVDRDTTTLIVKGNVKPEIVAKVQEYFTNRGIRVETEYHGVAALNRIYGK